MTRFEVKRLSRCIASSLVSLTDLSLPRFSVATDVMWMGSSHHIPSARAYSRTHTIQSFHPTPYKELFERMESNPTTLRGEIGVLESFQVIISDYIPPQIKIHNRAFKQDHYYDAFRRRRT